MDFKQSVPMRLYFENDPDTIEMALQLTEECNADKCLHLWVDDLERGEWVAKYCSFFLCFVGDDFVGYVCLMEDEDDKWWLHFATSTHHNVLRNIHSAFDIIKGYATNRGINEIYAESDDPIINKMVSKMGFTKRYGSWVYTILYG